MTARNKYPAICYVCGMTVAPERGDYLKGTGVRHIGCRPHRMTKAEAITLASQREERTMHAREPFVRPVANFGEAPFVTHCRGCGKPLTFSSSVARSCFPMCDTPTFVITPAAPRHAALADELEQEAEERAAGEYRYLVDLLRRAATALRTQTH